MTSRLRVGSALAIVLLFSSLGRADTYSVTRESGYDTIANSLLTNGTGPFGGQCASTSLMNSFLYLQSQYPGVYGTSLTTEGGTKTAIQSRNDLDTSIANPRLQGDVWNAKLNWVNTYAPGTTAFAAITNTAANSTQGKAYTQDRNAVTFGATGAQMWTWLTQQIKAGEDVELGMFDHMTTVMGYATSNTGNMYVEIIDPNNPLAAGGTAPNGSGNATKEGEWVLATVQNGNIKLSGFSVGSDYRNPYIYYMYAESVPEPSTLTMMSLAIVGGLMGWIRSVLRTQRVAIAA